MSNASRRLGNPEPRRSQEPKQSVDAEHDVPIVPAWVSNGGFLLLIAIALAALGAMVKIGHVYGAGYGWVLLGSAACGTGALWWQGYSRRLETAEVRKEQVRYVLHEITKADAMDWRSFERYCADLLEALGYVDVKVIGSTPDEDGVDVIATAPDVAGTPVGVQCKHWKGTVGPDVIRDLAGAISAGSRHERRRGIVMTNARATDGARARARARGIVLWDRPELQRLMSQARAQTEACGRAPGSSERVRLRGVRPAEWATAAILGVGFILLMVTALHQTELRMPPKATAPRSRPAASGPSAVVMAAFAAINRHDWSKLCRLWSHQGSCRGAHYRKMIAGYKLTARDVVTSLRAHDDAVSGRLLAYETTGALQTFTFSYKIRNGKITWGYSILVKTSYPRRKTPFGLARPPGATALKAR